MPSDRHEREDEQLRVLIGRVVEWPRDEGFADVVMGRIRRRMRLRKAILGLAVLVGAAVALVPAYELALDIGSALAGLPVRWLDSAWLLEHRTLAAGMAAALLSPLVGQILDD
jgi:hypothetical protein